MPHHDASISTEDQRSLVPRETRESTQARLQVFLHDELRNGSLQIQDPDGVYISELVKEALQCCHDKFGFDMGELEIRFR